MSRYDDRQELMNRATEKNNGRNGDNNGLGSHDRGFRTVSQYCCETAPPSPGANENKSESATYEVSF